MEVADAIASGADVPEPCDKVADELEAAYDTHGEKWAAEQEAERRAEEQAAERERELEEEKRARMLRLQERAAAMKTHRERSAATPPADRDQVRGNRDSVAPGVYVGEGEPSSAGASGDGGPASTTEEPAAVMENAESEEDEAVAIARHGREIARVLFGRPEGWGEGALVGVEKEKDQQRQGKGEGGRKVATA